MAFHVLNDISMNISVYTVQYPEYENTICVNKIRQLNLIIHLWSSIRASPSLNSTRGLSFEKTHSWNTTRASPSLYFTHEFSNDNPLMKFNSGFTLIEFHLWVIKFNYLIFTYTHGISLVKFQYFYHLIFISFIIFSNIAKYH